MMKFFLNTLVNGVAYIILLMLGIILVSIYDSSRIIYQIPSSKSEYEFLEHRLKKGGVEIELNDYKKKYRKFEKIKFFQTTITDSDSDIYISRIQAGEIELDNVMISRQALILIVSRSESKRFIFRKGNKTLLYTENLDKTRKELINSILRLPDSFFE